MELKKCRGGKFRTCRKLSGNSRHLFFFRLMIPTSTTFSFYFTFWSASQTPMTATAFQPPERKTEKERPWGRGVLAKIRWCTEISHGKNGEAELSRGLRGHKSQIWELRAEGNVEKLEEGGPWEWACRRVGLPCLPLKCRLSVLSFPTSHS